MPDYKEMYYTLFRASERAVNILLEAQRACEELYLESPRPGLTLSPPVPTGSAKPEEKPADKEKPAGS